MRVGTPVRCAKVQICCLPENTGQHLDMAPTEPLALVKVLAEKLRTSPFFDAGLSS